MTNLCFKLVDGGRGGSKIRDMDSIFFMKWKSGNETTERGYKFSYDGLDRLTKVADAVTTPIAYQGAFHFVDRANVANEYTYDDNGNLTKDLNRNITSITYNELNLPNVITFSGNRSIIYGYDAAGNKLSVAYLSDGEPTKMEYVGNRVYNNNMMTTLLTDEGYIDTGTTPAYHYYLRDHQGNNRVVVNQAGTEEEVNHYYPFGGVFSELARPSIQRYKYNGKELDRKFDLDMYDYGARHYDPALGRWFTVDPMAEKYLSFSPYVYVGNNPVNITDPNGMDWFWDTDSTRQFDPNVTSQNQLGKGQRYIGATDAVRDKKGVVIEDYRKDGSIIFTNETSAYNRMWSQANDHYNKEKEVGGFILENGKVLVVPDYNNEKNDSTPSKYGYFVSKDGYVSKDYEKLKITGQIHTHQDPTGDPGPSYYTGVCWGDIGYSRAMGGLPIFTIGHDGKVHGAFYTNGGYGNINGLGTRDQLLKGTLRLGPWLKKYLTIK